ncbi:uncharacterized protein LOC128921643 [Zeugodacus cucurbitae]|uniref:uncharacterized protein LOC128921643 n=1 Tax=Zeugodacus cucurbitae TaxID=28588 RepID=UPI0023D96074|nr:uncharacterized protein LOC128921643 [Zeugodacus cucurbitae]
MAAKILERYGGEHAEQKPGQHASTLEWAKKVLSDGGDGKPVGLGETQSQVKRQRSFEGESSLGKKPRVGEAPKFSEIAKLAGSIELGVCDRNREDGAISHDEWKRVAAAISAVFMRVIRGNPGPPPSCENAGWHYGIHKLVRCADERSASLYKEAVSLVGEVWKGAKLEAVAKEELPLRPRARVWLPAEPFTSGEIEEILRYCNPSLPVQDWKVIRLEKTQEPYRQALILLNKESVGPLSDVKGVISYGFEKVVLRVLPTDAKADVPLPPGAGEEGIDAQTGMDVDSSHSDTASIGDGSVFNLGKLFKEDRAECMESAELALLEKSLEDEDPAN